MNLLVFLERAFADLIFRLQEAILTIPRGITRLMDMLMDREVYIFHIELKTLLLIVSIFSLIGF